MRTNHTKMTTPSEPQFDSDLDKAYDTFIKVGTMEMDLSHLPDVVTEDITGFGSAVDERIHGIAAIVKLVENQIAESRDATFHYVRLHLRKRMLAGGTAALFVEEGEIKLELPDGAVQFPFRSSTILNKIEGHWKVVHCHDSTPVMSENDPWHINDWKKKNEELEAKVSQKTAELATSLKELKATQTQLVVQEKLAALGQLAAGIAHEIKNPINFVNNFSELSLEYIDEINEALQKIPQSSTTTEIEALLGDVAENLKKIHQHGTRVDSIVKSMLMHSRGGSGVAELTNLNELIREYVNLAFHGMRAGKMAINVKIELDLDEALPPVALFPEDFSRVILNLCKNAFDAMREKGLKLEGQAYLAVLKVQTMMQRNHALVVIEDNGPGVPESTRDKLFTPFFTTKKGTEGTGLGLSITHDIVQNHKGEISIESTENQFTRFIIKLPI